MLYLDISIHPTSFEQAQFDFGVVVLERESAANESLLKHQVLDGVFVVVRFGRQDESGVVGLVIRDTDFHRTTLTSSHSMTSLAPQRMIAFSGSYTSRAGPTISISLAYSGC